MGPERGLSYQLSHIILIAIQINNVNIISSIYLNSISLGTKFILQNTVPMYVSSIYVCSLNMVMNE